MASVTSSTPTGLVPWLLQRITGALLVIWIAAHFIFWHFDKASEGQLDFAMVSGTALTRGAGGYIWEMILAGLCVYHGLNGVRNIVYDYVVDKTKVSWLTPLLWIVGIAGFLLIGYHLAQFQVGH
ncbi:MAG: hypothetical protein GF320_08130 [Armatimonadia bacterium]|nr:hypothetical protein [Armatimonadia bacterium]